MDYLELSNIFLQKAKRFYRHDKKIPLQYRIVAKLLSEHDYDTARRFIEVNSNDFNNEYNYLLLDLAVECSANVVMDENRKYYYDLRNLPAIHTYKPIKECINFIRFLLENGANPNLPTYCNQILHIDNLQEWCDFFEPDFSELKDLLKMYM